jgi:hypothetical protein
MASSEFNDSFWPSSFIGSANLCQVVKAFQSVELSLQPPFEILSTLTSQLFCSYNDGPDPDESQEGCCPENVQRRLGRCPGQVYGAEEVAGVQGLGCPCKHGNGSGEEGWHFHNSRNMQDQVSHQACHQGRQEDRVRQGDDGEGPRTHNSLPSTI